MDKEQLKIKIKIQEEFIESQLESLNQRKKDFNDTPDNEENRDRRDGLWSQIEVETKAMVRGNKGLEVYKVRLNNMEIFSGNSKEIADEINRITTHNSLELFRYAIVIVGSVDWYLSIDSLHNDRVEQEQTNGNIHENRIYKFEVKSYSDLLSIYEGVNLNLDEDYLETLSDIQDNGPISLSLFRSVESVVC